MTDSRRPGTQPTATGTAEEVSRALDVLSSAARKGYAEAQFHLGRAYFDGVGVRKDGAEALRWIRRAADQNYVDAQVFLGLLFASGELVDEDYAKARHWWERAAGQGSAFAQCQLGHLHNTGTARDPVEAVRWWRLAANEDDFDAQFHLACAYTEGDGVAQDHGMAAKWLYRAARQGYPFAQNNLGLAFWRGEGVLQDHIEAYKWISLSAQQLPSEEKKETLVWRDRVRARMSDAQVAEAEQRVAAWTPTDPFFAQPPSPYFQTRERMDSAIFYRRYDAAAQFARENLDHIFDFVNDVILNRGRFDIPSVPALERGGTMLALADDSAGLERMREVVAAIPPLVSRIPAIEKHFRSRDLFRRIPDILAQRGPCLQTEMKHLLGETDGHHVAQLLAWLEKSGRIQRERCGKTYRVTLPATDPGSPTTTSQSAS